MIAPSPDWFVGIYGVQLCDFQTGTWKRNPLTDKPLFAFSSGSDLGVTFKFKTGQDEASPQKNIFQLDATHPNDVNSAFYDSTPKPFGKANIEKVEK
eukprot:Pgem_evm1s902